MHEVVRHDKCRLCGSSDLLELFSLGDQFLNDFVQVNSVKDGRSAPLELISCRNCTLVQLRHTAPQELLYSGNYWYESGVTQTMRNELQMLSEIGKTESNFIDNDYVLDIGANDGTLLSNFKDVTFNRVACEPAKNLQVKLGENCDIALGDFWSKAALDRKMDIDSRNQFKLIYAIGMFYDLDNPSVFVKDIAECLSPDGVFIAQLMCLSSMLEQNDLGNICHEHIEYYTYSSLKYLFEKCGLYIYKVEKNFINGGSYRIYARKGEQPSISWSENTSTDEIMNFKKRIDDNRRDLLNFLKEETSKGKIFHIYGASTKGNVVLQYYAIDSNLVTLASDRSPSKWGLYTIGTGIKIVSELESRDLKPDYYLVMPYSFIHEFIERESEWLSGGGAFILSTPSFQIIKEHLDINFLSENV